MPHKEISFNYFPLKNWFLDNSENSQCFLTSSENDIFADTLDIILETLESPFGYFGFIDNSAETCLYREAGFVYRKNWGDDRRDVYPSSLSAGLRYGY